MAHSGSVGWDTVLGCVVSVIVGGAIFFASYWRSDRILHAGDRARATVKEVEPGGVNHYPPYGSWGPFLRLTYERGGKVRRAGMWLETTKPEQYRVGQQLDVFVARRWPHRLRTEAEPNSYLLALVGLVVAVIGVICSIGTALTGSISP
jgi:hypothetical protein